MTGIDDARLLEIEKKRKISAVSLIQGLGAKERENEVYTTTTTTNNNKAARVSLSGRRDNDKNKEEDDELEIARSISDNNKLSNKPSRSRGKRMENGITLSPNNLEQSNAENSDTKKSSFLNDKEKELCTNINLTHSNYINIKEQIAK